MDRCGRLGGHGYTPRLERSGDNSQRVLRRGESRIMWANICRQMSMTGRGVFRAGVVGLGVPPRPGTRSAGLFVAASFVFLRSWPCDHRRWRAYRPNRGARVRDRNEPCGVIIQLVWFAARNRATREDVIDDLAGAQGQITQTIWAPFSALVGVPFTMTLNVGYVPASSTPTAFRGIEPGGSMVLAFQDARAGDENTTWGQIGLAIRPTSMFRLFC